jgi:hypothetical protein
MDFLVSEMDKDMLATDSLGDETYPGLRVYEMTEAQAEAVKEVVDRHLSPIMSDEQSYVETDNEEEIISDTELTQSSLIENNLPVINTVIPQHQVLHYEQNQLLHHESQSKQLPIKHHEQIHNISHPPLSTLPTPNIFSKISEDKYVEELREEVSLLRKKVALSVNMKTLMSRLNGLEDLSFQTEVIKNYSKRKFQLILTNEDFDALVPEQIQSIYKKTRESEKSDKFELIYKTAFDFGVTILEQLLNKYCFQVTHLSEYLLYEDISNELNDFKQNIETTMLGKYVDHTSPIVRIISYIGIQVTRAKLKV